MYAVSKLLVVYLVCIVQYSNLYYELFMHIK